MNGTLANKSEQLLMGNYRPSLNISHGMGCKIFTTDGRELLDLIGGLGTCPLGHGDAGLVDVIRKQSRKLINASNLFHTESQLKLAEKLIELTQMSRCFFSNSGTEANEAAIKLIRRFTGKSEIVSMVHSFHGRTMGSLSATGTSAYREPFEPLIPGFTFVPFNDLNAVEAAISESTAGVMLEPIQGECGIIVPDVGYLKELAAICRRKNVLLVLDEIQTGMGRTGRFLASQHEAFQPDIVTLAKGLANGLPIGATLVREGIKFQAGDHGSTFGGNSLCCEAAIYTLNNVEPYILSAEKKGEILIQGIKQQAGEHIGYIEEIRGKGLMIGIQLKNPINNMVRKAAKLGILINGIGDKIIRLLPPLTISEAEIHTAVRQLAELIKSEQASNL